MKNACIVLAAALAGMAAAQNPSIEANGNDVNVNADSLTLGGSSLVINGNRRNGQVNVGDALSSLQSSVDSLAAQLSQTQSQAAAADHTQIINQISSSVIAIDSMHMSQMQGHIDTLASTVAANISALSSSVSSLENATNTAFSEVRGELHALEVSFFDLHTPSSCNDTLMGDNCDFTNASTGLAANITSYAGSESSGDQSVASIVDLDPNDRPPAPNWDIRRALRLGVSNGEIFEYELRPSQNAIGWCTGEYVVTMWARVSDDFQGYRMLFHYRFFSSAGNYQFAHGANNGAALGYFPRSYQWQKIQIHMSVRDTGRTTALQFYMGYPWRSTAGYVDVTGITMRRLGAAPGEVCRPN